LPAQHAARDSRVAKGEMQRRSWHGNAVGLTDAFDPFHLCQDLRWRIPIVVFRTTHGAGCQNTRIEYAAEQHADSLLLRQRQKLRQCRLLQ
jgi:hypothetical protein